MTRRPFGARDRAWLLLRLFALGLVLALHPLPLDLHGWGLVLPARSAKSAYIVFECLQTAVFAAALFYGDMLPGMRSLTAYHRRLMAEVREAPLAMKLVKVAPFALGLGIAVWLMVSLRSNWSYMPFRRVRHVSARRRRVSSSSGLPPSLFSSSSFIRATMTIRA